LAVDDRRTRRGLFPSLLARCHHQRHTDPGPDPELLPSAEIAVDRRARRDPFGHHSPIDGQQTAEGQPLRSK
jgi:hypothetical protein